MTCFTLLRDRTILPRPSTSQDEGRRLCDWLQSRQVATRVSYASKRSLAPKPKAHLYTLYGKQSQPGADSVLRVNMTPKSSSDIFFTSASPAGLKRRSAFQCRSKTFEPTGFVPMSRRTARPQHFLNVSGPRNFLFPSIDCD